MTEQTADPRRIEWLPLDDLVPDPANPKAHDEHAIGASVDRFGMIDLIARDDRTGNIVSGHGRLKHLHAAYATGQPAPDGVRVTDDGTWLAPVIVGWSSEDDLAAHGALIALNQTTILGGWVDDALLTLLDELRDADQLPVTGMDDAELDILRRKLAAEAVFTHGTGEIVDEWRQISEQQETEYAAEYAKKVTVYFRDAEVMKDFQERLGITEALESRLHLPLGWAPYDRRQTWKREREENA